MQHYLLHCCIVVDSAVLTIQLENDAWLNSWLRFHKKMAHKILLISAFLLTFLGGGFVFSEEVSDLYYTDTIPSTLDVTRLVLWLEWSIISLCFSITFRVVILNQQKSLQNEYIKFVRNHIHCLWILCDPFLNSIITR